MRKNLPVTQREIAYDESATLTSATDPSGRITYTNKDFLKVSGFSEAELLQQDHNIVRHPDMPAAAFENMWQTLKGGKSWMGIVKNRSKNGDHYWVDAFVTPRFERGKITGYESVRVKPDREAAERANKIYDKLNKGAKLDSPIDQLSLSTKLTLGFALLQSAVVGGLAQSESIDSMQAVLILAGSVLAAHLGTRLLLKPLANAAVEARQVIENPVTQRIYTNDSGEIGELLLAIKLLKAKSRTIIRRLTQATEPLAGKADASYQAVIQVGAAMNRQMREVEQIAAAMQQMSVSVNEVARNAADAANSTNDVTRQSLETRTRINDTVGLIGQLMVAVNQAESVVNELSAHSNSIGRVLDVIKDIAEQTNLLALNAAIEAARAGDLGRGFAVVADEVRTLASRTHESTEEIQKMIGALQAQVKDAVKEMSHVKEMAASGTEHSENSAALLNDTVKSVSYINDMVMQIASAAEQQHAVSEEISRAVHAVGNLSRETAEYASQAGEASGSVSELSKELDLMVEQFDDSKR